MLEEHSWNALAPADATRSSPTTNPGKGFCSLPRRDVRGLALVCTEYVKEKSLIWPCSALRVIELL